MNCKKCKNKSIISNYCKEHFTEYFENKVKDTIKEFDLIKKDEKICVAVSGGKDSIVLLYLLNKFKYNVFALAIDEGIKGYRQQTIDFLKKFCEKHKIPLEIKSFREEAGKDLDDMKHIGPACNVCGTYRRFMLNKYSQEYDKIATGHNLDDEAQAVFMNLFKAQTELFDRQGPKTKEGRGFTQKIKPLYKLKEKEILAYAFIKGFDVPTEECPYTHLSFRAKVREFINREEAKEEGIKKNIVEKFLEIKKNDDEPIITNTCKECGYPSQEDICKACKLKKEI